MEQFNLDEYYARKKSIVTITGKAILFASMQFAIGSVEMSSKFSVKNFSNDQATLQNAADALSDYLKISIVYSILNNYNRFYRLNFCFYLYD